jgi:hypothetical protein
MPAFPVPSLSTQPGYPLVLVAGEWPDTRPSLRPPSSPRGPAGLAAPALCVVTTFNGWVITTAGPGCPRERLIVRCAGEEAADFCKPDRKGVAETGKELVGLVGEQQSQELHDGEQIQEPLTNREPRHEEDHEKPAHPHVPRGWPGVMRSGFHKTPPCAVTHAPSLQECREIEGL